MTLLSKDVAKSHQNIVGDDEDADIEIKLEAAEQTATSYLNRNVYASQGALDAAISGAPAAFAAARQAHEAAVAAAMAIEDACERAAALLGAHERFDSASIANIRIYRGIVLTSAIKAAILLIFGHLYENREDVVIGLAVAELPGGAKALLRPLRIGSGL